MKRFSEQLQKKSMSIRLKAAEKDDLRLRVASFMEYHPVQAGAVTKRTAAKPILSPFNVVRIPVWYMRSALGAFALLVVIGVPTLAEQAVPGDVLYPIKVQVTEEIRSSLSRDAYQKVAWETTRLERRISEARQLAKAGKLTPDVQATVLEAVQAQKITTESEIATLRETDAEGASLAQLTYATMLDVQSTVLKADDSASTTMGKSTIALSDALDASLVEVQGKDDADTVSIERLRAQLELETTRSYELLQNISPLATEQEQKDITRRLADVDRKIELATTDGSHDDATRKAELRSAWSDVQKLISFMTDIDVRAALAIETLVPVVPTDSERMAAVIQNTAAASQNLARIEKGIDEVKNDGAVVRITAALPQVRDLLATASTSATTNVAAAESAAREAYEMTVSMLALASFPAVDGVLTATVGSSTSVTTATTSASSTTTGTSTVEDSAE